MKKRIQFAKEDLSLLRLLLSFAGLKKVKLYLVGGMLRDLLLNKRKENPDYDFCLKKGAINFGRALAQEIKAGFVVLDKAHGACRLVKTIKDKIYTLDFTDFRGPDIKEDLLHRDFTINAIALDFKDALAQADLEGLFIDPYGGGNDIRNKIIRVVDKTAFLEDPLRIMRAFSFEASLKFNIDKETLKLIGLEKSNLKAVSGERIRDELFKVLESEFAYSGFLKMDELKILRIIFPEIKAMSGIGQGPYHHLDVWQHTLEAVKQIELLISYFFLTKKVTVQRSEVNQGVIPAQAGIQRGYDRMDARFHGHDKNGRRELPEVELLPKKARLFQPKIQAYLNEIISPQRSRKALLKLGAFLHDIGKPASLRYEDGKTKFHGHERIGLDITQDICRRLKLSNNEINSLKTMVLGHLRPGYLADIKELTPRAKFRYFRDTGSEAASVLLLSIADQRATKGPLTNRESRSRHERIVFGLIKEYFKKQEEKKIPRLLNGNELMRKLKLEPSPLIGKILSEIEELQAIGRLKTKQEAYKAAKALIKR
ncbi:MAG: HD domain-containing protein [Candidatus Omnitrophota bacterium]|nr:HD domain-containing protein [Candidatus Omnitrophota bacterium]